MWWRVTLASGMHPRLAEFAGIPQDAKGSPQLLDAGLTMKVIQVVLMTGFVIVLCFQFGTHAGESSALVAGRSAPKRAPNTLTPGKLLYFIRVQSYTGVYEAAAPLRRIAPINCG